jgi:hypothetical protein
VSLPQIIAPLAGVLAALLVATDRRIERSLREAGAITPERAASVPRPTPLTAVRLRRLTGVGAIRMTGDRYYIDADGWRRWRATRRFRALTVMAVILAALTLAWLCGWIRV